MAGVLRHDFAGALYHVTARVNVRRNIRELSTETSGIETVVVRYGIATVNFLEDTIAK